MMIRLKLKCVLWWSREGIGWGMVGIGLGRGMIRDGWYWKFGGEK